MRTFVLRMLLFSLPQLSCVTVDNGAARNRASLTQLTVGMSRTEVLEVMGTAAMASSRSTMVVRNPYRVETLKGSNGISYEVLFYCTVDAARRGGISDDDLTPVILKDGVLLGWGWSLLGKKLYRDSALP